MVSEDLDTSIKGKAGELLVIGELLQRGYKVYLPMIDLGIDCLVDVGNGNYKEVQIKYRENEAVFNARRFAPRDNFYVICCLSTRGRLEFWTIPSKLYRAKGKPIQVRGRDYLQLNIGREGSQSYNELAGCQNFGKLLEGASEEVRKAVSRASNRIEGPHFKQKDYEREVLLILSEATGPLRTEEIITAIKERMGPKFSRADLAPLTRGRIRWEGTARFAIYQGLKPKGLIEARTKNQWMISAKGKEILNQLR